MCFRFFKTNRIHHIPKQEFSLSNMYFSPFSTDNPGFEPELFSTALPGFPPDFPQSVENKKYGFSIESHIMLQSLHNQEKCGCNSGTFKLRLFLICHFFSPKLWKTMLKSWGNSNQQEKESDKIRENSRFVFTWKCGK